MDLIIKSNIKNVIPDYIRDAISDDIKVVIKNNSKDAIPDYIINVINDL